MKRNVHTYHGEDVDVTYDVERCIHVRECVHGLPNVFDPNQRPWIRPDESGVGELVTVVERCPTGALHYDRRDGGPDEAVPDHTTVTVDRDGPLYAHGDVRIEAADGEDLLRDTRVALCRCGRSENKPLCDNSHDRVFEAAGTAPDEEQGEVSGPLTVTVSEDGPLLVEGSYALVGSEDGAGTRTGGALCRCGGSANKPFCDGTHAEIGFSDD